MDFLATGTLRLATTSRSRRYAGCFTRANDPTIVCGRHFARVSMQKSIHPSSRGNRTKGDESAHCCNHRQSKPISKRLGHEPNSFEEKLYRYLKSDDAGTTGKTASILINLADHCKEFVATGQKRVPRQNVTSEVLLRESVTQTPNPVDSYKSWFKTLRLPTFRFRTKTPGPPTWQTVS